MGPAGWVHCSLPDWAQFVALHLRAGHGQPALLKPQTFRKLHSGPGEDAGYTLGGWGLVKNHPRVKGVVLMHDGSNTMNYAAAWLALEPGFAVKPKYSARVGPTRRGIEAIWQIRSMGPPLFPVPGNAISNEPGVPPSR